MTADTIIDRFAHYENMSKVPARLTDGYKGALLAVLDDAAGGTDARRRVILALTGKTSTKALSDAEWYALSMFVAPVRADTPGAGWVSKHGDGRLMFMCKSLLDDFAAPAEQLELID